MHWSEPYIGLPYLDHGRDRAGADCWGLVRLVMAEVFHVELPAYENSGTRDDRWRLIEDHRQQFNRVAEPCEGAIALARTGNRRPHIGICLDPFRMLHAMRGVGACIVSLNSPQWRNAISGYYVPHRR